MNTRELARFGAYAAVAIFVGVLLSGLVGAPLVSWLQPQPTWENGRVFAENFSFLQTFPYFAGFLMIGGFLLFHVTIYLLSDLDMKRFTLPALLFAAMYGTLVFFNYIVQTTFLPELARNYRETFDPIIGMFTMSNPSGLGWAIEMWGYGILGVASLFAVPFYLARTNTLDKVIAALLGANGVLSIAGALIVTFSLSWIFTPSGLFAFVFWNLVVLILGAALILSFRRQARPAPQTTELKLAQTH